MLIDNMQRKDIAGIQSETFVHITS